VVNDMSKRKRAPGKKFGKKELDNKEEYVRRGEPLLQQPEYLPSEEDVTRLMDTIPARTKVRLKRDGSTEVTQGTRIWTSDESTDLHKLVRGETSIDWSKGTWHDDLGRITKQKDEPNLIDLLIHGKGNHTLNPYRPQRLKLLTAQRFVLDASASRYYGDVTMSWARQALLQHELARAPYDLCWMEFDSIAYATQVPSTQGPYEDLKVGYLYDHGTVYIASVSDMKTNNASFMPYRIVLNTPMSAEEELAMAKFLHLGVLDYRIFLMGTFGPIAPMKDEVAFWSSPEIINLCRGHRFEVTPDFMHDLKSAPDKVMHTLVQSSTGILKQVILLLLLLTRPNKHVYFGETAEPTRHTWLKSNRVPLVSYNRLTMHLEQKDEVRRIGGEVTGRHHREHDVKQHWCQSRKIGRGCMHQFVLTDPDHGECIHGCGAKTWWRKPHKRGNPALGTVSKSYDVRE
jgi:hypothetical protein